MLITVRREEIQPFAHCVNGRWLDMSSDFGDPRSSAYQLNANVGSQSHREPHSHNLHEAGEAYLSNPYCACFRRLEMITHTGEAR
jgi:hypothetical protein